MKRYIKASISPSAPEWLRDRKGVRLLKDLARAGIAVDRANFSRDPIPGAKPIYLIHNGYYYTIYCPGVNDSETILVNGRSRQLGNIAKSKLPELADDVVYVDLSDSNNLVLKKERYKDPRYTYRYHDKVGDYAGQYKKAEYLGDGKYGEEKWSTTGKIPSNESRARDKSGYKIPSPESRIAEFYSRYPDRITDRVNKLYRRLSETKQLLMDADFDSARPEYDDNVAQAYRTFSDAVYKYRSMLKNLDEDRKLRISPDVDSYQLKQFSETIRVISSYISEIENLLA